MSDITVILDKKELVVRMDSTTIRIDKPGAKPERIPMNMVKRVIVIGNPMISCGLWRALSERNIPAVLLPSRGKSGPAYMGAGLSQNIPRRMAQYRAVLNPDLSLHIARRLVLEKLEGQEKVIREMDAGGQQEKCCKILETRKKEIFTADTREALMGHEGVAAAAYFKALAELLPLKWQFRGRNRRPPKDPVNSLLSLSYVISGSDVLSAIHENGLDPTLGFLHTPQPGRDNLMLDLMEPLRPRIDRFVVDILDKELSPKDFRTGDKDGCRMIKKGRGMFYNAWAVWMAQSGHDDNFKPALTALVRKLVNSVENPDLHNFFWAGQ